MRVLALVAVLAVGCSPPTIIPAPPDVEGFPIGVLGWDGDKANAILRIDDSVISSNGQSLHWLGLSEDPQPLFPGGTTFVELAAGGVPLVSAESSPDIFQLSSAAAGPVWLREDPDFDLGAWGWRQIGDLDFCTLNRSCVFEGACNVLCEPRAPAMPASPDLRCPDAWRNIGEDGEAFCFPQEWLVNDELVVPDVNLDCGFGEAGFGGGCELLSPCTGQDFGPIPGGATNVVYVDADAAPGGTGALGSPYNAIGPALVDGATIMLAAGTYSAEGANISPAHIIGTCSREVQLELSLRFVGGSVVVRNLRVAGDNPLLARDSVVEIHGVQFLDESVVAIRSSTLTMTRSDLRGRNAENNSLVVNRSFASVEDSVLRKMATNTSTVVFERVRVVNERPGNVINVVDSSLDFSEVELFGQAGYAMSVGPSEPMTGRSHSIRLKDSRIVSGYAFLLEESLTTLELNRVGIVHRPAQGLDRIPIAILEYGPSLVACDLAITGFGSGILTESPREPDVLTKRGHVSLDRAWIEWTGPTAFRAGRSVVGGDISNVSFHAKAPLSPLPNRVGAEFSAVALTSGRWNVNGVRLRPQWRNAIEIQDRSNVMMTDVEVAGPHGRSLILQIGATANIRSFAALEGSDGISITPQVGELGSLALRDIALKFRPVEDRGGFSLDFGAASIEIESFVFDGIRLVEQTGEVTLSSGEIGFTRDGQWTEDFRESLRNVVVYRQEELR